MAKVEIRLSSADVAARVDEMRRWLDRHRSTPLKFISTGSSDETVVIVEFIVKTEAEDFAREFSGDLVSG